MAIIQKRYAHLNQADSGSLHRKLDATEAYVTGSLTVKGAATLDSTLTVANLTDLNGALEVAGQITGSAPVLFSSTLKVDGQADMVDVLPQVDLTYDLGSAALRWAELHAGTAAFTNLEADYLDVAVTASVAQLTGSAGAVFSAGDVLVQAGQVSASTDLKAGGQLVVAGNADLNGQLDVAGAAEFHSTVSASGNAQLGGTLTVAGDADLNGQLDVAGNFSVAANMFSVIAASGDTSIAGDLVVSGDLTVMGDRIEAQITELRIEDGLVTLMSGSPSRAVSDNAGIEVDVGAAINGARPTLAFSNAEDAWTSNLDFNPTADLTYDLGIPSKRWNEINAGSGSFAGPLAAATVSASAGVSGGSISTDGSLTVEGAADLNGGLDVIGAVSASEGVTAASFTADGLGDFGSLDVSGNATLTSLTASVGAEIQGQLSASSLVVEGAADFYGTATFHGTFAVPGEGSFGSLTVGGINMSPISSSNPVSTVDDGTAVMLSQNLDPGDMAKFEIEVIARGGENAAAWKISVAALRNAMGIEAAATELSKEFFGALGANLDVDINVVPGAGAAAPFIQVIAKGAASAATVYWDCQIVKKMVLDSATGARKY